MNEIWKDIKGYEGYYQVSSLGRVKSLIGWDGHKYIHREKIIKQLPQDGIVILLEEKGVLRGSKDFSIFLERTGGLGKELVFVIGSGVGLHSSLKSYSNYSMSLSPLTFPHNMARVLLEEQIYRACTILAGKEYHK